MSNNQYENQATFERCPHDRKNPYAMISTELIYDTSLSTNARMILIYMLTFGNGWKFFHSQLTVGVGIGEFALNSGIDELIQAGYAERTRERIQGVFQPYKYTIREFKKCLPDVVSQPGSTGPVKPVQSNINAANINSSNINLLPPLTPPKVPNEKAEKKTEEEDFSFLSEFGFSDHEKMQLGEFSIDQIKRAIAISKQQTVKSSLIGLLLNILRNPSKWPDPDKMCPKKKVQESLKFDFSVWNASYWSQIFDLIYQSLVKDIGTINAAKGWAQKGLRECGEYLESNNGERIYMKDNSFLIQVENFLRKNNVQMTYLYEFIEQCKNDLSEKYQNG